MQDRASELRLARNLRSSQQQALQQWRRAFRSFDAEQRNQRCDIDIAGLEQVLSAVVSAMEGDVPKEVREATYGLDAEVDSIRFTVSASE
jgi:hypothetical protein